MKCFQKQEAGPSKKELRKMKRAEEQARSESAIVEANELYGDYPICQSAEVTDKKWTPYSF